MSLAQDMVNLLTQELQKNVNVAQITVDGQTLEFRNREEIINELAYWQSRVGKENGSRPLTRGFNLGTAF